MAYSLRSVTTVIAGSLLLCAAAAQAQNKSANWLTTNFEARTHYSTPASDSMKYRLFKPANYDPTKKYPIVVALHGIGERGYNNINQLTLEELAQPWVRDSVQAKHPHFVMVPQCPPNQFWWASNGGWAGNRSKPNIMITEALDSLKSEFALDTTRFYVAGLSMGGFGTFELLRWAPTLFAAAVPTAGGGDTGVASMAAYTQTPMWVFHSLSDPTVSATRGSRTIVSKLEERGKDIVWFASDPNQANPVAFNDTKALVTVDSLRKAVYETKADFLYSEVRNAPGSGNPLHQAGWWEAWRHAMVTDWVFSKRKVDGVSVVAVTPGVSGARTLTSTNVRVVFRDGRTLLERTEAGRTTLFTLEGKRMGTVVGK